MKTHSVFVCVYLVVSMQAVFALPPDLEYYIFDTHLHTVSEGSFRGYQPFPGALRSYDFINDRTDHCLNLQLIYENMMSDDIGSNIKRVLMVEGNRARRPGYDPEPGSCEAGVTNKIVFTEEMWEALGFPGYGYSINPSSIPNVYPVDDRRALVALYDMYSELYGCSGRPSAGDGVRHFFPSMIGFSIERFDTLAHGAECIGELFNYGECRWIGEILGNDCFAQAMANDEEPYWPDKSIENLFAVATNVGIPVSVHLPSVSEETWASYYQQNQDDNLFRAYQFLNILDAAKSDLTHPSTHAIDATIHMSMGQAHYIQQKAFTWQAYADVFEGPQYGNFLVELQKVNPGYLSKEVFTADLIHAVYADHENDELLDNLVQYSSHFTLCSHEYPKTDFSPEPGFYYGTVIDQAMEAPVPVSCTLNLTDCYGVDGCPGSFYAVGTQATDANAGIVMRYRIENNQIGWFPMTGQPSDLPPLTAITGRELDGSGINLFIAGYRRDLSGQPVNGEIWQFNSRTETWTQFTPPETLCVNDMEFISYTKLDLNYEDLYCVCANGKIARWRTTSNLDGSDPTTVWNVWANTAAAELTGLWIEENGGINGYTVGWKPGQTDKDGCLLLFDQDNDEWIELFPQISLNIPLNEVWGNKICDDDSDVLVAGDSGLIKYKPPNFPTFMDISSGTTENLHGLFGGTPQSVYICGDNGVVLRFNKDNFQQNPVTVIQSSHSSVNKLCGIYGADPKDGERNVWAVGHNGTNGIVQQYRGGRVMFDGFTDYWDTFFTYLYDYASENYSVPEAIEAVHNISHCNAERCSIMTESLNGTCSHDTSPVVIDEIIELQSGDALDYQNSRVILKSGAGIICHSGTVTLNLGDHLILEHGSFIDARGVSGSSGGNVTINVDGPMINFGDIGADSADETPVLVQPPAGGSISINCARFINGIHGRVHADGIAPDSSAGTINISSSAVTSWGKITSDARGELSGETQPLAGTIEISVSDYNLINTGTISASCAYGKGGKGGTIGLYVAGSISNSGLIVTGTFGDFDGTFGAPMAGNIVLMTSYSFENTGIIDASSWLGDNGKGGTIDVISTENITNQGQISADTYGLETGSDHPEGGDIYISTGETLYLDGSISVDSKTWQDPDGDGTVVLDYGQMGD